MIATLIVLVALSVPSFEQNPESTQISPCPDVFNYEPTVTEKVPTQERWYGVINLSTDVTLHSIGLNIVLDSKADLLGNWLGVTSSVDNIDFRIENTTIEINPGSTTSIRFFVQYGPLVTPPKLVIIRVNEKEICNANKPKAAVERPDLESDRQPLVKQPFVMQSFVQQPQQQPDRNTYNTWEPPRSEFIQNWPKPNRPTYNQEVPVRPTNPLQLNENPFRDDSSQNFFNQRRPYNGYQATENPFQRPSQRPAQMVDCTDNDDDYFIGGPSLKPCHPRFQALSNNNPSSNRIQCGQVAMNGVTLIIDGVPTLEGQWPWQIALYQAQEVTNLKYLCGGTLVSHRHVITAAHCVTKTTSGVKVDQNTLMIFLGKHNLRTSVNGVQFRFVSNIIVHPDYKKASPFSRDVAILELYEPVIYTDWVRPACLWPETHTDIQTVIGVKGSVVGWGIDSTGKGSEELHLLEMPVVDELTCIRSSAEFFVTASSNYTYCAGDRKGASACLGDSGGGMVFQSAGIWYLRGLVSISLAHEKFKCNPYEYVIFTDLAKFLPWIKQNVNDF